MLTVKYISNVEKYEEEIKNRKLKITQKVHLQETSCWWLYTHIHVKFYSNRIILYILVCKLFFLTICIYSNKYIIIILNDFIVVHGIWVKSYIANHLLLGISDILYFFTIMNSISVNLVSNISLILSDYFFMIHS